MDLERQQQEHLSILEHKDQVIEMGKQESMNL